MRSQTLLIAFDAGTQDPKGRAFDELYDRFLLGMTWTRLRAGRVVGVFVKPTFKDQAYMGMSGSSIQRHLNEGGSFGLLGYVYKSRRSRLVSSS
jgi:hypothetical protein